MLKKIILSSMLFLSLSAFADTMKVGENLPEINLSNQHSKAVEMAADAKTLLFAVEKPAADMMNEFLMKQDKGFLNKHKSYFIADISGMPALITKMFAIPKMKKRPYDILLSRKKEELAFIPHKENFITVVNIEEGKVASFNYVETSEQLMKAF